MFQLKGVQIKYLHVIYKIETGDNGVRSVDIAKEMGVSKCTVHKMLNLFAGLGLVSKQPRSNARLTVTGKKEGLKIHNNIISIYPFFAEFLSLDATEALESAYNFLYYFSDNCIEKLLEREQKLGLSSYAL